MYLRPYTLFSILSTLERRIIFDYDKYGDSPNCLGKDELEDLAGQVGLTQGKKKHLYILSCLL